MSDEATDEPRRLTPEQQRMVTDHLYIARRIVLRYAASASESADLEQMAVEAISEAAFGYDPSLGTFRAYAWRAAYHRVVQQVRQDRWRRRAFRLTTACLSHQRATIDFFEAAPSPQDELQRLARRAATAYLLGSMGPTKEEREASSAEQEVLLRNRLGVVQDALGRLPEEQQHVLVAHYFEERTLRSLCDELGVSYNTIRRRHDRGLDSLREQLQALVDEL